MSEADSTSYRCECMSSQAVSSILESASNMRCQVVGLAGTQEDTARAGTAHAGSVCCCWPQLPGMNVNARTGLKWPSSVCSSLPEAVSNTPTVPSMLPHARRLPSGLYATLRTKRSFLKLSSPCGPRLKSSVCTSLGPQFIQSYALLSKCKRNAERKTLLYALKLNLHLCSPQGEPGLPLLLPSLRSLPTRSSPCWCCHLCLESIRPWHAAIRAAAQWHSQNASLHHKLDGWEHGLHLLLQFGAGRQPVQRLFAMSPTAEFR